MSRYPDDPEYSSRRRETGHSSRRDTRDREPRDRGEPTRERRTIDDRDSRMTDAMDTRMDTRMETRMDTRVDPRLDSRIDPRIDPRIDNRMDIRTDPRANAAARLEPRPDPRVLDGRSTDPEAGVLFRDPTTGEVYREVRAAGRSPYARDDRYDDTAQRSRTQMDTTMALDRDLVRPSPHYSEYFCPGEGIEREVIQHEICKYLGQDATCRPGRNDQVCRTIGIPG